MSASLLLKELFKTDFDGCLQVFSLIIVHNSYRELHEQRS